MFANKFFLLTSMEALKHTSSEHGKDIKDDNKEKEPAMKTTSLFERKDNFDISTKLRCFNCKNIVSKEDKFNELLEEGQM